MELRTMRPMKNTSNLGPVTSFCRPLAVVLPLSVALMDRTVETVFLEDALFEDFLDIEVEVPDFLDLPDIHVSCFPSLLLGCQPWTSFKFFSCATFTSSSRVSLVWSICFSITERSMLLAAPLSLAMPFTSCSGVISPVSSSSISLKTSWWLFTARPIAAIQVFTVGSAIISANSSLSMRPSSLESPFSRSLLILAVWSLVARSFSASMMVSSLEATLNVSWRKTPVITLTMANPMISWWERMKKM
mmetsp:Transcript_32496/g.96497  ORF Transcript_32496/g.96497 Transcript_32496/m.96497 type:complete len:246 (+) Transcript_32496:495-1232(+)